MEGIASFEKPKQATRVEEYLNFIDVLGIPPREKEILQSLVEAKKRGKLAITLGGETEEVFVDPSMEENEIAVHLLNAFDLLATRVDPSALTSDIDVRFEEMKLH